ncbi:hypothetical protein Q2T40_20990 [Winogradskyella maritima]|nr:hypothetical protein [Winogradskyella maritima]
MEEAYKGSYWTTNIRSHPKEQETLEEYTALLRRKTYILANAYEKERLIDQLPSLKLPKQPRKIAQPIRAELIEPKLKSWLKRTVGFYKVKITRYF